MRLIELGRIAAQAEALRWRRLGRRQAMRGVFAAIGGVFAIGVLVSLHVAGALALVRPIGAIPAALTVGGVDLVIAAICLVIAARDQPDRIEREARAEMAQAAVMSALVLPLLRRSGFSLAHWLLGGRRGRKT
jgi:uncharacterized membrane protein YvlD (DUF360 family)